MNTWPVPDEAQVNRGAVTTQDRLMIDFITTSILTPRQALKSTTSSKPGYCIKMGADHPAFTLAGLCKL